MGEGVDPVFPTCVFEASEAQRISARSDADDFAIVLALPKSGSTAFTNVVALLLSHKHPSVPAEAHRQGGMSRSIAITSGVLRDKRSIGAWQAHAPFSHISIELLRFHRIPCVFLARHPLDHLIALACHWRKPHFQNVLHRYEEAGREHVHSALGKLRIQSLRKSPAESVEDMIREGYLRQVLWWLESWICEIPHVRCVPVRLEQLNAEPQAVIAAVAQMVRADESATRAAVAVYADLLAARRATIADGEIYPSGWTGAAQLWRHYCPSGVIAEYNLAVRAFLSASSAPKVLFNFFPDLLV